MESRELIGRVVAEYLRDDMRDREGASEDGCARFLLDRMTGAQVASVCSAVAADAELAAHVEIHLPDALLAGQGVSEHYLTSERTVFWRNRPCEKAAMLLANTNDDQGQSLRDIAPIGATELRARPELWVRVASAGIPITEDHSQQWMAALRGLRSAFPCSLEQFSAYVALTRSLIATDGLPLFASLGKAVPVLRLPADSHLFDSIPLAKRTHQAQWKRAFQRARNKRACYLRKESPSNQPIDLETLEAGFANVKGEIAERHHQAIQSFIRAPRGWNEHADRLASLEWEKDNLVALFRGLRSRKLDLGTETLEFYEDEKPNALSGADTAYLRQLKSRRLRDPNDADLEFFETHAGELADRAALKGKWDRFIYGQPVECTDFLAGLLTALERLFARARVGSTERRLRIRTQKDRSRSKWAALNTEAGLYFSFRYRGLAALLGNQVEWHTAFLLNFDSFLNDEETRARRRSKKYRPNRSRSRAANELKFYIDLEFHDASGSEITESVQLVWKFSPSAVEVELRDDFIRLAKHPLLLGEAHRELLNQKGAISSIELSDVSSLMPVYRQDRGSLIPKYDASRDLAKLWPRKLREAAESGRLNADAIDALREAWKDFEGKYQHALSDFEVNGLASLSPMVAAESFAELIELVRTLARGTLHREDLLEPLLQLGTVPVRGGLRISAHVNTHLAAV